MNHALSKPGTARLLSHLRTAPLLAFDFDGTLAPIVPQPQAAQMPESTRAQLALLLAQRPAVVLSGRSRSDVLRRLDGLPFVEVMGNHGSEPYLDLAPLQAFVQQVLPPLRARLHGVGGIEIEDKGCSISAHYRRAFDRRTAIRRIQAVGKELRFGCLIPGKYVMNLLPPGALDKGQGLLLTMRRLRRSHAVYIGDDTTDERVFALPPHCGVLGIRVGYQRASRASLFLRQQRDIDPLLSLLRSSN